MKNLKIISAALCLSFGALGSAYAADLDKDDLKFMEKAAQSGHLEVMASELAQKQAASASVKTFAQQMIDDHKKVEAELKTLAGNKNVTLPTSPSNGQQKDLDSLAKLNGADFDKEYADEIAVDAHEDAVKLFKDASEDAKDADVKAFAAKTLPALQQHLDKGKALKDGLKQAAK